MQCVGCQGATPAWKSVAISLSHRTWEGRRAVGEALRVPWSRELVPPCTAVTLCVRDNCRGKRHPHTLVSKPLMLQGLGITTTSVVPAGQFASSISCSRELAAQMVVRSSFSMGCATYPDPAPQTAPFLPLLGTPQFGAFWGFLSHFQQCRAWSRQRGFAGSGWQREPPINANHFPYTTCFCCRGYLAISGYRVLFCFHSLRLCDLSF